MYGVEVVGLDAVRSSLSRDADLYRRDIRKNMRRALRLITEEAKGQVTRTGIARRTGTLERSIRGVVKRVSDYEIKGIVKPRRVTLGQWIDTRKKRVGDPFYWYFLEYGTRGGFSRSYSTRSRNRGREKTGAKGIKARAFLKAAASATRDRVVEIVGHSLDVFFD